jgi:hypothetical protein
MGLLADIYLAYSDEEALKYDSSPDPFADRLQYKGFTELQLSTLWAIILGVKWEAKSLRQFINVFHTDEGERLICRLPAAMLNDLCNLTPGQVSSAAEKWAATAEMRCKPADSHSIVESLIVSARKAKETNQSVYLWNSV